MKRDRQPQRLELVHLVLHQGDQRRNDQSQAVDGQGRQLIAEALSAAGGHDAQAILPGQHRGDHFPLPRPKRGEPEPRQEDSGPNWAAS